MDSNEKINQIVFLDIETVPQYATFSSAPENYRRMWERKSAFICPDEQDMEKSYRRAGIYAEFGKIVCISTGFIQTTRHRPILSLRSFCDTKEEDLLKRFFYFLEKQGKEGRERYCAHNGKEFDFPYISRRAIIHRINLPKTFQLSGKKPWEVPHFDTLELWKCGDFKHYTSLELLAMCFGLKTPKQELDGSKVCDAYWEQKDLKQIQAYCERDVITVARVFLAIRQHADISEDSIIWRKSS
jgi:DNA polymerase elongation subunit (family B)